MTRAFERTLLTLAFVVFVATVGASSLTLSPVARLAPLIVACVTLALLGIELIQAARLGQARPTQGDRSTDREKRSAVTGRDELVMFAWLLLLLGCAIAGGLVIGLPVFLCLYLRFRTGQQWTVALAGAAVLWFVLYGVLVLLLRVRLYEGLWRT